MAIGLGNAKCRDLGIFIAALTTSSFCPPQVHPMLSSVVSDIPPHFHTHRAGAHLLCRALALSVVSPHVCPAPPPSLALPPELPAHCLTWKVFHARHALHPLGPRWHSFVPSNRKSTLISTRKKTKGKCIDNPEGRAS